MPNVNPLFEIAGQITRTWSKGRPEENKPALHRGENKSVSHKAVHYAEQSCQQERQMQRRDTHGAVGAGTRDIPACTGPRIMCPPRDVTHQLSDHRGALGRTWLLRKQMRSRT